MKNPVKDIRTLDDLNKQSREYRFVHSFYDLQNDAAEINKNSGFVDQEVLIDKLARFLGDAHSVGLDEARLFLPLIDMFKGARVGLKLALSIGEISEALEAVRKTKGADDHIPAFSAEEAELADVVIRLMNYAHDRKLRLAEAIVAKNEYNRTRKDHTREARAGAGGKKF